jgi:hypothetical protein
MTNILFVLSLIQYFSGVFCLDNCLECSENNGVCSKNGRSSLWINNKCVFDSSTNLDYVFYTGEIFSLGACGAVQSQVGRSCFNDISNTVISNLNDVQFVDLLGEFDNTSCTIYPDKTPCLYSTKKFSVSARGYECSQLVLLYEEAIDKCLRNKADARFWTTLFYWLGLIIIFGCLVSICGCITI